MTYSMGLGAVIEPKPWDYRGSCYSACEQACIDENGGVWLPLYNDYCAASCFDDSGCENLPFSPPDPEEAEWHDVTLPPKAPVEQPSTTTPKPKPGGSSSSSSSTKNGGSKPTTDDDDDEPSPVAPSGTKIGLVLLGIAGVIAGGVWLMKRKRR